MIESRHAKWFCKCKKLLYQSYIFFKVINKCDSFLLWLSPLQKSFYNQLRFHELSLVYASVTGTWHILGWGKQANKQIKQHTSSFCFYTVIVLSLRNWATSNDQRHVAVLDLLFVFIIHYWEFSGRVPRKSYFINYNLCFWFSESSSEWAFKCSFDLIHWWVWCM